MKKTISLYIALVWCLGGTESCALDSVKAMFEAEMRSFWEKNDTNMQDTLPWPEFAKLGQNIENAYFQKGKVSPFVMYNFGKRHFIKIPGFDDGSCLWSHLGITPKNMYERVMAPYIEKIRNEIKPGGSNDSIAPELFEIVDLLDPLKKFSKEKNDIIKRFQELSSQDKEVKGDWLQTVSMNGGKEIPHEQTKVAYRPANGDHFFQEVANYLKTNIVIFDELSPEYTQEELSQDKLPNKTSALNIRKEFISAKAKDTLYLLQGGNGLGLHYDVLVEQNSPVSNSIVEEMKSYVGSKNQLQKI